MRILKHLLLSALLILSLLGFDRPRSADAPRLEPVRSVQVIWIGE
ncbi:hypothetical protein [Metapseudomonas furukawaii]|jgi:hypothetical protein|uniref:Uncharacterized protein n=1 Tax=Metapseudomonas furukawaii TaxID=1149133 RepID=A0AAD1C2U6_METFU|nr:MULTISPECIES: hypothetical protein [Pseudomonas]ELS28379.1 hypothetical protein ppKF707_2876 [Pseudomonas furukawaii]BAU74574.1 hypothetical protein KF707C_28860 [Pseudomonas furukawaii]